MVNANTDSSTPAPPSVASELHAASIHFLEGQRRLLRARPGITIGQQKDFLGMMVSIAGRMVDASSRLERAQPKTLHRRKVLQFPAGK